MIQVFDVIEGKNTKSVPSKKYGVHLARFTHHSRQILHASTKVDGTKSLFYVLSNVVANLIQILYVCWTSTKRAIFDTSRDTPTKSHPWPFRPEATHSSHVPKTIP
jgi:hypothetical protein